MMVSLRTRNQKPTSSSLFSRCVVRRRHMTPVAKSTLHQLTGTGPRDFRLIIRASCHYQPNTQILYTSRTGTVPSVIQAESI